MQERPYQDKLRRVKYDEEFQSWETTSKYYMNAQGLKWEMIPIDEDMVIRVLSTDTNEAILDFGVGGLVYEIHNIEGIHHSKLTTAINFGTYHSEAIRGHRGYRKRFYDAESDVTKPDRPGATSVKV